MEIEPLVASQRQFCDSEWRLPRSVGIALSKRRNYGYATEQCGVTNRCS